jgi:death-on-curing protein
MADEVRYLSLAEVEALHIAIMERMSAHPSPFRAGGEGLLESAVMRPQMAAYYEGADLLRQAALLAVGISQAQALDGNKRTAFAAVDVFLRVNGLTSPIDSDEYAHQLELVAERTDSLDAATARFEDWLRTHVR